MYNILEPIVHTVMKLAVGMDDPPEKDFVARVNYHYAIWPQ